MAPTGHQLRRPMTTAQTDALPVHEAAKGPALGEVAPPVSSAPTFEALYEEHFAFVWRNARRLGVQA